MFLNLILQLRMIKLEKLIKITLLFHFTRLKPITDTIGPYVYVYSLKGLSVPFPKNFSFSKSVHKYWGNQYFCVIIQKNQQFLSNI